ncbi:hypothetical protein, partial [Azovibrio restrictus]|uniref:hypothetical protein n=1 Tax=Azovibrio restrictus TaxID=146938 RepID=UPI001B7F870C
MFMGMLGGNPVSSIDPLGLAGTVTIYSSGNGGSSMTSGHAWISYQPDGGSVTTCGTWGNNPTGEGNGLFQNLELGRSADASRSMHIDDAAEKKLLEKIDDYKSKGEKAWRLGGPCSSFARDTWNSATNENLNANLGPISNPTTLKESIIDANGGVANAIANKPEGGSSASSGSFGRSSGASSLNSLGSSL